MPSLDPAATNGQFTITKYRVQSGDNHSPSKTSDMVRPSSSTSFNKGAESVEDQIPRAASVEAELFFGTLPKKKKKRKWSGIKRISSPLFRKRKSFTHGSAPNHTPSSIAHTSIINHTHPVPTIAHVSEKETNRSSLHESPRPLATILSASKLDEMTDSKEVKVSPMVMNDLVEKLTSVKTHRKMSVSTLGRRGRGKDECFNALNMMTTLSSNRESLSTLISYICLPKCISK